MEALRQDLLFGVRMLRKSPGFTIVAVLALALGIGANATIFTIANAYLFQSLPFTDSDRVVYISSVNNATGRGRGESYPDYRDFGTEAKSFAAMGAFTRSDVDVSDKNGLPTQYKGSQLIVKFRFPEIASMFSPPPPQYEPSARTPVRRGSSPPPESACGVPAMARGSGPLVPMRVGGVVTGSGVVIGVNCGFGVVTVIALPAAKLKCPSNARTSYVCCSPAATASSAK